MTVLTTDQEAEALRKRFQGPPRVSQAWFAETFRVPGGASMVNQHIKARRPISLDAALCYAKGFGVRLEDISPRLAIKLNRASDPSTDTPKAAARSIADTQMTPEIAQLLLDLADLPPRARSAYIDQVHQAAEAAREAHAHLSERTKTPVALAAKTVRKATLTFSRGDGNPLQSSLVLQVVPDPFSAAPSEREQAFYNSIAGLRDERDPQG